MNDTFLRIRYALTLVRFAAPVEPRPQASWVSHLTLRLNNYVALVCQGRPFFVCVRGGRHINLCTR